MWPFKKKILEELTEPKLFTIVSDDTSIHKYSILVECRDENLYKIKRFRVKIYDRAHVPEMSSGRELSLPVQLNALEFSQADIVAHYSSIGERTQLPWVRHLKMHTTRSQWGVDVIAGKAPKVGDIMSVVILLADEKETLFEDHDTGSVLPKRTLRPPMPNCNTSMTWTSVTTFKEPDA